MTTATKACTKCGTTKPLDDFPRARKSRDGRHSWCKACHRENVATLRQDPDYRARGKAQIDSYHEALRRLRDRHRDEFDALYADELDTRGVT